MRSERWNEKILSAHIVQLIETNRRLRNENALLRSQLREMRALIMESRAQIRELCAQLRERRERLFEERMVRQDKIERQRIWWDA